MRGDIERALTETEDFLHRQLGSRAAREASKRKVKRGINEVLRRVRRAVLVLLVLMAGLIGWSILVSPIGFLTWLLAVPTVFLAAMITMFWPSRRARREERSPAASPNQPLGTLSAQTEEWLLARCDALPRPALPAADFILGRLRELQPELARLDPATPAGGDARRLIGQHLPRLVDSYLDLPPSERDPGGIASRKLAESLDIVAEELDRLSHDICRERGLAFVTQTRFIESRYRAPDL